MSPKEHYKNHLANFYSWMAGDFDQKQNEQQRFLEVNDLHPVSTGLALDLGCGHGLQTISMLKLGYRVKAIDFNAQLLEELKIKTGNLLADICEEDIREVKKYASLKPELITCLGDTILHLENKKEVMQLMTDCFETLVEGGKFVISFRDYSAGLSGTDRFIPIKSDDTRILTCCLDYETERIQVTDILHEKHENRWQQKISSYYKVRIPRGDIKEMLENTGFKLKFNELRDRMITIIAIKP